LSLPGTEEYARELEEDGYISELIQELYKSTALFCRIVFPGRFKKEFGPLHADLFKELDSDEWNQLAVLAHRDFGKTSILQLGYAAKKILYCDAFFVVPVSCSATQAVMQSENLKNALATNPMIKALWGDITPEGRESVYSKEMWTVRIKGAPQQTIVLPRGSGQQVRGLIYGDSRPDLVLVDDLEDPENLLSEEQRAKQRTWFFSSMKHIVDIADIERWRTVVMGTMVHHDALIGHLIKDKKHWKSIEIPIGVEDKEQECGIRTLWSARFTQKVVDFIFSEAEEHGELSKAYMEYMNNPSPGDDGVFTQNMFRRYDPVELDLNDRRIADNMILIDPADTVEEYSNDTGIVALGVGVKTNSLWVREAIGEKLHTDQVCNTAFDMAIRYRATVIAVEVTSLEDWIKHKFMDAARVRGLSFHFVWIKARDKKEKRIKEIVWYYRQGFMFHHPTACAKLEGQLLSFPYSTLWDVMDALANFPKVLEEAESYFRYPGSDNEEDVEEEYRELLEEDEEEEEPVGWEII